MGSSYTNTKRSKSGKQTKFQKRSKRILYLGAIALACAAAYTAIQSVLDSETTKVEEKLPHGSIQELVNPQTFMSAYLATNCKPPLLTNTQTIRVMGKINSGERNENFVLIKKQPNLMLFTIERESHQITFGVNGETVWRRIRTPKGNDSFIILEADEEVQIWKSQAHFYDRIIEAHLGSGVITSIEPANWQGSDCLAVHVKDADDKMVEILIDPLTMHPIAEQQDLPNGSVQQTVFADYRDIDGMPIPFQMTTSIDGKAMNRIQLESAALNTGIMSRLFEVPDALPRPK